MAFLFVRYFPDEIAFSNILRNELKHFASSAILSFAEKKSQLASNFKLTGTPTILIYRAWYNGSYTIMAKPIKMLELHYQMIQFLKI